jgi:peptidoglycan/LPS O-acetylase OafA/YrhL
VLVLSAFVLGPAVTKLPIAGYFGQAETYEYITRNITAPIRNCCNAWYLPGVFDDRPHRSVNGPLWTLPSEFYAYGLVLVAFLVGLLRFRVAASIALVALAVASIAFPLSVGIMAAGAQKHNLLACFIVGMLFALWKDKVELRWEIAAGLLMLAAMTRNGALYPVGYCIALFYGSLVMAAWPPFMRLKPPSDISYGVYLYGWPSEQIVFHLAPGLGLFGHMAWSIVLAFGCGLASWKIVEKPAIKFGRDIGSRMPARASPALVVT